MRVHVLERSMSRTCYSAICDCHWSLGELPHTVTIQAKANTTIGLVGTCKGRKRNDAPTELDVLLWLGQCQAQPMLLIDKEM